MKNVTKIQYHSLWVLLTLCIIGADQITKLLATHHLFLYQPVLVFPGFNLTLAHNPGAAFSFLSNAGSWRIWFFLILSLVVSGVLIHCLIFGRKASISKMKFLSYIFILGGALGNFIDRLAYGHVIDFIDVYIKSYHWPIFNVADSAITVGAVLFLFDNIRENRASVKKKKA